MNSFEKTFFTRYIPAGEEIVGVIHRHIIIILGRLFVMIIGFVFLPSFLYYQSLRVQEWIPFFYFEIYLIVIFVKIIYDLFNWYNDVWVITRDNLYNITWSLFKSEVESVNFESIEGVETEQNGLIDMVLGKGNIVVHKHGSDTIRLHDVSRPFESTNILAEYTKKEDHVEEKDRFDLILEALGGIVNEYLDRKGLKQVERGNEREDNYIEKIKEKDGTIDLREKE